MNAQTVTSIKRALSVVLLSLIPACGGGGGGGGGGVGGILNSLLGGSVIDGYVKGATVCLDLNSNGVCDSSEPTATTGASGVYSLSYPSGTNLSNLNVIASVPVGASDSVSGTVSKPYTMIAPASQSGALLVTPLTTLVSKYVTANGGTAANAASSVLANLGLPPSTNVYSDYIASNNTPLINAAQIVNTVIQNSNLGTATTAAVLNAAIAVANTQIAPYIVANPPSVTPTTLTQAATVAAGAAAAAKTSYTGNNLTLFTQFNSIRQLAGAGLLAQNALLDTAAANHASYLVTTYPILSASIATLNAASPVAGLLTAHYEPTAGYTTPSARATTAGYAGGATVSELLSFGSATSTGYTLSCSASIEDSVYHLTQLLSPFVDIGLSYNLGNGTGSVCNVELGISTGTGQYPTSGNYVVYPSNGQVGVPPIFYNQAESPNPAPLVLTNMGHPIVISLYDQTNTLLAATDITSVSFTLANGAAPVATTILGQTGITPATGITTLTADANISAPGILVLLPTLPLAANTTYTVTFSATVKLTPVTKTWLFTTGAAN